MPKLSCNIAVAKLQQLDLRSLKNANFVFFAVCLYYIWQFLSVYVCMCAVLFVLAGFVCKGYETGMTRPDTKPNPDPTP